MITATSTVKVSWYCQCVTQVVLTPSVRDSSCSGAPCARLKSFWYPQCATQVGLTPLIRDSSLSDHSQFRSGSADHSRFWSG